MKIIRLVITGFKEYKLTLLYTVFLITHVIEFLSRVYNLINTDLIFLINTEIY